MNNNQKKSSFRMLVLITTPKLADTAAEIFKNENIPVQYRFNAEGTASSDIMDMLGLGSIDKCLLAGMLSKELADEMLDRLRHGLQMHAVNSGIAFTIPLSGMNKLVLRMLTHDSADEADSSAGKEEGKMTEMKYVLVAAIVNRGFTSDVMTAAKAAGARGGTVINSRRICDDETVGFWGLGTQEEKEIVMILTTVSDKISIMQSISDKCGINSEAKGIVLSMPIDSVTGI